MKSDIERQIVSVTCFIMLSAGCAVQRYGRMMDLVDSEAESLSCEQIEIEIDKCNAFIRDVSAKNKKFTAKDVVAFLGDFGIGDSWEVTDAIASATMRITQLEKLKAEKKCP